MSWPGPRLRDRIVAAALTAAAVVETVVNSHIDGGRGVTLAAALALVALLLVRKRPDVVCAVAGGVLALQAVLTGVAHDEVFAVIVTLLLLMYRVAAQAPLRQALVGAGAVLGGEYVALAFTGDVFDALFATVVLAGSWLAGRAAYRLHNQAEALRRLAAELEVERERSAANAAGAERARIARDLHDVVAHHVSVMVVQAGGARGLLTREPATAEQALRTIEQTGRDALLEMRRLLGVLRSEDAELAPQPGVARLPDLIGAGARLTQEGTPRPLPAGLDVTVYRIVQECLSNARRHAAGTDVDVTLSWLDGELVVRVSNPLLATPGPPGLGLAGMRERVALYGGVLTTTATDGAWVVEARLPLVAAPEPVQS